jgi:hypothetical protein
MNLTLLSLMQFIGLTMRLRNLLLQTSGKPSCPSGGTNTMTALMKQRQRKNKYMQVMEKKKRKVIEQQQKLARAVKTLRSKTWHPATKLFFTTEENE